MLCGSFVVVNRQNEAAFSFKKQYYFELNTKFVFNFPLFQFGQLRGILTKQDVKS